MSIGREGLRARQRLAVEMADKIQDASKDEVIETICRGLEQVFQRTLRYAAKRAREQANKDTSGSLELRRLADSLIVESRLKKRSPLRRATDRIDP